MRRAAWRAVWSGAWLLVVTGATVPPAAGQERVPDRRAVGGSAAAVRGGSDAAVRENLLDLLQQLEALQAEVRQLRNTTEVQGHELEQLKGRQRALYDDLDKRLREAERRGAAAPASAVTPPPATGPTSAAEPPTAAPAPRTTTPNQQQEYDAAFGLMKQGLYEKAVKSFREFLAKYPNSGLADNAQYWIAEGNYVLRNYKLALEEFAKVLGYANSTKQPDAMLKIGYAHYELGAYDKARKALAEVQERYPGTPVARLAAARLDKIKKEGH
jgi:tol-pal system protein YbgF